MSRPKNSSLLTCDYCGRSARVPDGQPLPLGWILLDSDVSGEERTCCGDKPCGQQLQASGAVLDEDDPAWGGSDDMEFDDDEIEAMAEEDEAP